MSVRVVPVSSSNSAFSSAVMRSSDGCVERHSTYSANMSPLAIASCSSLMGLPASVRRKASDLSRTAVWSDSGMPKSIPITRIGITMPNSATMSKRSVPTSGSRQLTQNARTWSSKAAMRFGVNTRDIRPRCIVCRGGSSNSTTPGGSSIPDCTISRMSLRALEKVSQLTSAFSTSAWRERAHTSKRSL